MHGQQRRFGKPMFSPAAHPRVQNDRNMTDDCDRSAVRGTSPAPHSLPENHVSQAHNCGLESQGEAPLTPAIEAKREHFEKSMASAPQQAGAAYRAWLAAHHGAQTAKPVPVHPHDAGLRASRSQHRLRHKFKMPRGENLH